MNTETLVTAPPSGRNRPLLIDDVEYSTAVIRQGAPIPWTDTAVTAGHLGQVRSLLNPDAVWVDVQRLYAAHLQERPDLAEAMGARSRVGYPLRVLLSDNDLMTATEVLLRTAADTARRALVLRIPSPAGWLRLAHEIAGTTVDSVDGERASLYIAEWLTRLAGLPVALVLLDARTAVEPAAETLADCSAITNVADHFDWSVAMWTADGVETAADGQTVAVLPAAFWTGSGEPGIDPGADIVVTTIPSSAAPEQVLEQLAKLN